MDANLLEFDEFEIECRIRNLNEGTNIDRLKNLLEQVQVETTTPVLIPTVAHIAASKNPKRELRICSEKINTLHNWLQHHLKNKELNRIHLYKIKSRILHVQGRLFRISKSKVANQEAISLLEICTNLLDPIEKVISEVNQIEELESSFSNIELPELYEDSSSAEEDDFDKKSKVISSNNELEIESFKTFIKNNTPASQPSSEPVATTSKASIQNSSEIKKAEEENSHVAEVLSKIPSTISQKDLLSLVEIINSRLNSRIHTTLTQLEKSFKPPPHSPPNVNESFVSNSNHLSSISSETPSRSNLSSGNISWTQPRTNGARRTVHFDSSIPPPEIHSPPDIHNSNNSNFSSAKSSHLNSNSGRSEETKSLSKWNIRYGSTTDDKQNERSVDRFLFQVEFLANAYNVSSARLVKELSVLLRGEPYEWYWNFIQRNGLVTWPVLRAELVKMFRDRRTDDEVRHDLESRKQKYDKKETFLQFYHVMLAKTLNFQTPYSDVDFLRILKQNMRPGLQIALAIENIPTIDQLIQRCMSLEDIWTRNHFDPEASCSNAPRRNVHELYNPHMPPPISNRLTNQSHPTLAQVSYIPNPINYSHPEFNYTPNYQCPSNPMLNANHFYLQQNNEMSPPVPNYHIQNETLKAAEVCAFNQSRDSKPFSNPTRPPQPNAGGLRSPEFDVCFNCFDLGHWSRDCPQPCQRKTCNGCHHGSSFSNFCYRCKINSGNFNMEGNNAGKALLRNQNPNYATNSISNIPKNACPDLTRPPKM